MRLVARLARGLALRPNVVLAYTGHDTLADVKMNLEVASSMALACADKEDMQQQLEALGTGMPLWEVVENKRWEVRLEVEKARIERLHLQATMIVERKARRAAAKAAGMSLIKK